MSLLKQLLAEAQINEVVELPKPIKVSADVAKTIAAISKHFRSGDHKLPKTLPSYGMPRDEEDVQSELHLDLRPSSIEYARELVSGWKELAEREKDFPADLDKDEVKKAMLAYAKALEDNADLTLGIIRRTIRRTNMRKLYENQSSQKQRHLSIH